MTPTDADDRDTDDRTEQIRTRYNRIAPLYDLLERPMERKVAQWRAELLSRANGSVLEVGGRNGKEPSVLSVGRVGHGDRL